jgi:mRNA-degrading endonuclease toxin of MazEF toxin-antitoxin module
MMNSQKDFDRWNQSKQRLHKVADRREIWWCSVGVNVGNELDGTGERHDRPILVIRPFNAQTFFGVFLIGHLRDGKYYFPIGKVDDREATANLSQVRLLDTKRLIRKITMADEHTFAGLQTALINVLFKLEK